MTDRDANARFLNRLVDRLRRAPNLSLVAQCVQIYGRELLKSPPFDPEAADFGGGPDPAGTTRLFVAPVPHYEKGLMS